MASIAGIETFGLSICTGHWPRAC